MKACSGGGGGYGVACIVLARFLSFKEWFPFGDIRASHVIHFDRLVVFGFVQHGMWALGLCRDATSIEAVDSLGTL